MRQCGRQANRQSHLQQSLPVDKVAQVLEQLIVVARLQVRPLEVSVLWAVRGVASIVQINSGRSAVDASSLRVADSKAEPVDMYPWQQCLCIWRTTLAGSRPATQVSHLCFWPVCQQVVAPHFNRNACVNSVSAKHTCRQTGGLQFKLFASHRAPLMKQRTLGAHTNSS